MPNEVAFIMPLPTFGPHTTTHAPYKLEEAILYVSRDER